MIGNVSISLDMLDTYFDNEPAVEIVYMQSRATVLIPVDLLRKDHPSVFLAISSI